MVIAPRQKKTSEMTRLGAALRALGSYGGGTLGALVGMSGQGASAGHSMGQALSRWLGSGDYSVSQNSIVNSLKASGSIPSMHNSGQSIVVRHKEFVCEVTSSSAFAIKQSLPINPGLSKTFPWLSDLANCYQQYKIKGMVFHYVPTSGNAVSSTNNALGSVMLQTSYRSNDSAPVNKTEVLNEYWSSECVPSETLVHPIECNPDENPFNVQYIRGTEVPSGDNQLLYDLGVTHVCVSGQQADNIVLGDLWVTYEIELKKPIVNSNVTKDFAWFTAYDRVTSSFSNIWGTAITTNIGNVPMVLSGNVITIPVGYVGVFYFTLWIQASGTFTAPGSFSTYPTLSGCTTLTLDGSYSLYHTSPSTGTFGGAMVSFAVTKTVKDASSTITIPTYTVTGGTLSRVNFFVNGSRSF